MTRFRWHTVALAAALSLLLTHNAGAQDKFCDDLKRVIADASQGFSHIRTKPTKGSNGGIWKTRVNPDGMSCLILGGDFVCVSLTKTRAASEAKLTRLVQSVAGCFPGRKAQRNPDEDLPWINFESSTGAEVSLFVQYSGEDYSFFLGVYPL